MSNQLTTWLNPEIYATDTIFKNVFVREYVNPEKLFNIIHTANLVLFNDKRHAGGLGVLYKTERDLLILYQYQYCHSYTAFISEWYQASHKWGRIMPDKYLSMSVMHRPTRHTLCDDNLVDIDLVNCHYEIVLSYMIKLEMPCVAVADYCENASAHRRAVADYYKVSTGLSKSLFIRLIYGGSINGWLRDNNIVNKSTPKILVDIQTELAAFIDVVFQDNQHIHNDLLAANPRYFDNSYEGKIPKTIMSFWCQSIERYLQEQIILFLHKTFNIEIKNVVPCQDGFMLQRKDYQPTYIEAINDFIRTELKMVSRVINKPFDEKYRVYPAPSCAVYVPFDMARCEEAQFAQYMIDVILGYSDILSTGSDENIEAYSYNGVFWEVVPIHKSDFHKNRMIDLQKFVEERLRFVMSVIASEFGLVKIIIPPNLKSSIISANAQLKRLYAANGSADEIAKLKKDIAEFQHYLNYEMFTKPFKRTMDSVTSLSTLGKRDSIIKLYLKLLHVPNISWDAHPDLFAFDNGIMDLRTGEMIQPRKDQFIRTTCGWSWDREYPYSRVEFIDTLVKSILPIETVREYYLMYKSTGLSGHHIQKVLINTGVGSNGKSMASGLEIYTLGNYSYKIGADALCSTLKTGCANPVIANLDGKRAVFFAEPDAKQRLSSATIKDLTGESKINARTLYSKKTDVILNCTLSGDCNNIPHFNEIDHKSSESVMRRLVIVPFITKAVNRVEYDAAEDKTLLNIKANYAENVAWNQEHKQAYFVILLNAYRKYISVPNALDHVPPECQVLITKHLDESCNILSWIGAALERVDDVATSEAIPLNRIYSRFKSSDDFKTFTKVEQRKYCQKYFIELVEGSKSLKKFVVNRDKYHNHIQLRSISLVGYRFIEDIDDAEVECGFLGNM